MRSVELEFRAVGASAQEAYDRVRDFARYPELVAAVRKVTVHPAEAGRPLLSDWEVDFRNGVLCWSEEDVFDDTALTITFGQTEGDFETFDGQWEIRPDGAGASVVRFSAKFDFGLPSLAGIIDPVAERVLRETITGILRALLDREAD
ncbi:type II toxin-antitoxin system RatA family toxin [Streptoverticillium reticulum]|uniref:type II toxin-antitoxin system RatA family toxin n=1 Tax=Streptoverticillium reticulum TaxID=1433415 RepID=UPI0039BF0BDC